MDKETNKILIEYSIRSDLTTKIIDIAWIKYEIRIGLLPKKND